MPSISELGQMEFMGFPAYKEAQNQVTLANMMQQQKLQAGQGEIEAQNLRNLFDQANNPQKLDANRLANEGSVFDNQIRGVKARNDVAMEGEDLEVRRQKAFSMASEEKLKALEAQGQAEMMNPDPTVAERGRKKMEATWEEFKRRQKAADDLKKTETIVNGRKEVADNREDGLNSRNATDNETRRALASAKNKAAAEKAQGSAPNAEKAAVRSQILADETDDPELKAYYLKQADGFTKYSMALKNAVAGTKPDMAQFGIQTNVVNTGMGQANSRPAGAGGQNAPPMSRGAGDPPAGAGLPTTKEEADTQRMTYDMAGIEREYMNAKDPAIRKVLGDQMRKMAAERDAKAPVAKAPAIQAPAGRVVIYKDGKPVGSVPQAQVEAAKKQGYTLN